MKLITRILTVLTLFLSTTNSLAIENDTLATNTDTDTASIDSSRMARLLTKIGNSKAYGITYVGVPLVVTGLIVKGEDARFRHLRNDYMPSYRHRADDVLQYSPAMAMLTLKACGVESRSSWGRMLVSDAFSCLAMAGVVNALKYSCQVERPDGSNRHSFPSGHTATAFMTATMLNKEYGHKSPWIGIGAYSVASTTALMRMANNKHWLSDVLCGAGIGVMSTELGYFLADLIFKDKGINKTTQESVFDKYSNPSFFGLYIGMNLPLTGYDVNRENEFRTTTGSVTGIEGAGFFNHHFGIGGRYTISNTSVIVNKTQAGDDSFKAMSAMAGAYFSFPVLSRLSFGAKALAGCAHYSDIVILNHFIEKRTSVCLGSGVSMQYKPKERYGVRFFLDYNALPPHSIQSEKWMHAFILGISAVALFANKNKK